MRHKRRAIERALIVVGVLMFLGGLALNCASYFLPYFSRIQEANVEFPFSILEDVAVDARGRIYVADPFYHRIQKYSADGVFERGWKVQTSGAFALRTTAQDRVVVATARGNKRLTYDCDGNLLEALEGLDVDECDAYANETETTGHYAVMGVWRPRVIDTRTGATVLETTGWKRLIAAPFPSALYAVAGWVIAATGEGLKCLRQRSERRALVSLDNSKTNNA